MTLLGFEEADIKSEELASLKVQHVLLMELGAGQSQRAIIISCALGRFIAERMKLLLKFGMRIGAVLHKN